MESIFLFLMLMVTDPDDYQLHFESPTHVPEETTYSEWVDKIKA